MQTYRTSKTCNWALCYCSRRSHLPDGWSRCSPESLSAQAILTCKSTSCAPPYISSPLLTSSQKGMEEELHSSVRALVPMLPLWASPESPPEHLGYSDIGLSPLEPKLMQANALAMVMPVMELQQPFQRDPALEGCVEWFVNTIQRCKAAGNEPLQPDDRRLTCTWHPI